MIPSIHYHTLHGLPEIGPIAQAASEGDWLAGWAVADWLEEQGEPVKTPFEIGKSYLICTVTLYYVGRVVESDLGWVKLESASWVHWTGRLSTLLAKQSFAAKELASRRPRTELVGEAILSLSSVVAAYPWSGDLPKESFQ